MQVNHYALTAALASAVVAMSAQAQSSYSGSTPSQVNAPTPTETQSGQVPATQPMIIVPATPGTVIVVEKSAPGVTTPATREDVRSETLAEMKAGHIPRGEQSTATHGTRPDFIGSEVLWQR